MEGRGFYREGCDSRRSVLQGKVCNREESAAWGSVLHGEGCYKESCNARKIVLQGGFCYSGQSATGGSVL